MSKEVARETVLISDASGPYGRALVPFLLQDGYQVLAQCNPELEIPPKWSYWQNFYKDSLHIVNCRFHEKEKIEAALENLKVENSVQQAVHLQNFLAYDSDQGFNFEEHLEFIDLLHLSENMRTIIWPRIVKIEKLADREWMQTLGKIEDLIRESSLRYRIIHSAPVIGYPSPFHTTLVHLLAQNKKVNLPPWSDNKLQFLFIRDLQMAIQETLHNPDYWSFITQLSGVDNVSFSELLLKTAETFDFPVKIKKGVLGFLGKKNLSGKLSMLTNWVASVAGSSRNLVYPQFFEEVLQNWEGIDNGTMFFDEIFHFPANLDHILKDYLTRID